MAEERHNQPAGEIPERIEKMRNKMLTKCFVLGLTLCMLTGCGSSATDSIKGESGMMNSATHGAAAEEIWSETTDGYESEYVTGSNMQGSESSVNKQADTIVDRKLIKNVSLEVETKDYDGLMGNLEAQIIDMGGYIENMDSYNGSSYNGRKNNRYANMTIRIPQNNLYAFLTTVSDACNVVKRNDSVNDVTLSYMDTQSRKEALEVEYDRLLALLEKADELETIIMLEERLTNVRYQLESLESQLRSIDNKVTYSTVRLNISEVQELTPVVIEEPTVWERIQTGFTDSLTDVVNGALEIAIWFIVKLPKLIIWAVLLVIGILIFRGRRKKKAAKMAAMMSAEGGYIDKTEGVTEERKLTK